MAFSIHFLEACRASQVSDKNCVSSQPYSWLGLHRLSVEAPRRPIYKVGKYRHKVSRRLPRSRSYKNTLSVINVKISPLQS